MSQIGRRRGKDLERWCAKFYSGNRVGILGFEDIRLTKFSGEAKEREKLPASIKKWMAQAERNASGFGKIPFLHLHENGAEHREDLVLLKATDFLEFVEMKEEGEA